MDKSKPTPNSKTNSKSIDDNFFTDEDYQFLLDDIEEAIAEGNRKYGYGEPGYIDGDGNYYPFPQDSKLKKSEPKPKRKRRIGPSVEQVAVARGIINIKTINVSQEASP